MSISEGVLQNGLESRRSSPKLFGGDRSSRSPLLLVSVRGAAEARAAVVGGADIIDVKEPSVGPLGRAGVIEAAAAAKASADLPWTIACGELIELSGGDLDRYLDALAALQPHRPPWGIKFGLSGVRATNWTRDVSAISRALPQAVGLVAVGYADADEIQAPAPEEVIDAAVDAGSSAILIDTFYKRPGGIVASRGLAWLDGIVERCRGTGLPLALAGGLRKDDLAAVAALGPAIVAIRTAACSGGREGNICPKLVASLKTTLEGSITRGSRG